MAYDTAKHLVEQCANTVVIAGNKGAVGFNLTTSTNFSRSDDPERFIEYREWLKSVLYLGSDTNFYCRDVDAIIGTYFNWNPSMNGPDYQAMESILRWVVDSGKCKIYFSNFEERLNEIRTYWYNSWRDTTSDSTLTPWDTTGFLTIDQLGLSILRAPLGAVDPVAVISSSNLGNIIAECNPFTNEVALKVELHAPTILRLDIFDELGRQIYGSGLGYKPEGAHQLSLQTSSWPSGAYYARLSTPSGEVKTVRVIKE